MKFAMVMMSAAAVALSAPALGQEGTDPRALEECSGGGATFVTIADCLPEAHVAFAIMDAFDEIYPSDAAPLKTKCAEINDNTRSASICVMNAIDAAIKLKGQLPEGATLADPVFNAANDPELLEDLTEARNRARGAFPDQRSWGGGMYMPYQ